MYESLGTLTLTDGTAVEAGVVAAPDLDWAAQIECFLAHQDDIWQWQNHRVLHADLGLDVYFYLLHQKDRLVSSMMSVEAGGVGIRGHVWTPPQDRRNGACSRLQTLQMEHFRQRNGRFLALYTDYNSVAFHIYRDYGFHSVEANGGHMWYLSESERQFAASYFAKSRTAIETLAWRHWPTAVPLFMVDLPGQIRCAPFGLVGRQSSEYALLDQLRQQEQKGQKARVMVLRNEASQALVGLAAWSWHPSAAGTCLVDIYCHPQYWDEANSLLAALELPAAERYLAYGDCRQKEACLLADNFRPTSNWAKFPLDFFRQPLNLLPQSSLSGHLGKIFWHLVHSADTLVCAGWQRLGEKAQAARRIPAKWPQFPLTHRIFADLTLYEKN